MAKDQAASEARRVLVVDDERHIRSLLEIGLGDEGYDVRSVPDGQAALHAVREWSPHAIVLDWMMPKVDGVTLIPMVRALTEAPILMLTAKSELPDRIEGLGAGADDYLPKPFEMAELAARIDAALRRPRLARRAFLSLADLEVDVETREVRRGGRGIELSAREFDLLLALLRYPRRVFTRDELLDRVWGNDRIVGHGTVETYISYLRAKVDQGFEKRLIHTHRGAGYSLREA
jgi:DNA-binding response OmpR family regulator